MTFLDQRTFVVLSSSALLRLVVLIVFPYVADFLTARVEISTPVSSYKRLLEGIFLHQRGLSPYDGGVFHQPPLLLALFETISSEAIFVGLDILNALALRTIAEKLILKSTRAQKQDGTFVMGLYLFNPFTLLSCLGRSTNIVTNTAIIQAVLNAIIGNSPRSILALALGAYLSLYPALLLPPLLLLCWQTGQKATLATPIKFTLRHLFLFLAGISALLLATPIILGGSWSFAEASYGAQITVPDLTPNLGLWWYFFIEIFDPFRDFFIGVFWLLLVSFVGSFTIRLQDHPLFVTISLLGLFAIFKPYPSFSDISLYLGFLPLYKHLFPSK